MCRTPAPKPQPAEASLERASRLSRLSRLSRRSGVALAKLSRGFGSYARRSVEARGERARAAGRTEQGAAHAALGSSTPL